MWYAKVVCELLILAQGNRWNYTGKGKHDSFVFLRFAPRSWSSHDSSIMEPPAEEAPVHAPKRCGNPDCPDPTSTSRLQLLPKEFTGKCVPGAKHFHRQKGKCARWCGFKDPPKKAGRKRTAETMAIPVGKQLDADRCPPILRSIDELWGYRCTSPAPHGTPLYTHSLTRAYSHAQAIRHLRDAHGGEEPASRRRPHPRVRRPRRVRLEEDRHQQHLWRLAGGRRCGPWSGKWARRWWRRSWWSSTKRSSG